MNETPAIEWRKPREVGFKIQLPSGKVARIRPITSALLYKLGRVPDALTSFVMEGFDDAVEDPVAETSRIAQDNPEAWNTYVDGIVETAFVYPRIVENPSADDEISIEDVEDGDKEYVVSVVFTPASQLAIFLERQSQGSVESVDTQQAHQPETEPATTD